MTIRIIKSPTADSRTCDVAQVTEDQLKQSSLDHIRDVGKAIAFFNAELTQRAAEHDYDKLTEIAWFYECFRTKFYDTSWWDNHRKIHRHHLGQVDGVPSDVNLIDVLEMVADCVMAGMARSGEVYDIELDNELLQRALTNTVELLKSQIVVAE